MKRSQDEQVAFDRGDGQRGCSHRRDNPYRADVEPLLHAAFDAGWAHADAELNGGA